MLDHKSQMDEESFIQLLCKELGVDPAEIDSRSRLIDDCLLDSLGMYELLLIVEELGMDVDEDALMNWEVMGDVYAVYQEQAVGTP